MRVFAVLGVAGIAIGAGPAPKPAHGAAPWPAPKKPVALAVARG